MVDENENLFTIEDDDVVIFFNFRTDRGRELTETLSNKTFMNKIYTNSICMSLTTIMTKHTKM
jgi:bisphosphoglycerate-independent phosphoglycerate mutase (AlkP superfamily)